MVMNFMERLQKTDDIILHYAPMHTILADWGWDMETNLSHWIVNNPEKYQEALSLSFDAGCHLACTQTQSISPWRAVPFGMRDKVYEYNYTSAKLAREATPPGCYVLAMVSTTNPDFLEPLGNMTYREVYDGYKEMITALLEGGIDVFEIAGNHIDEALIAIEVARDLCDLPIISQNIFYITKKKGYRTMMGADPVSASEKLQKAGVEVIGGSCGLMSKTFDGSTYFKAATELVKEMRKGCSAYLSIQPNAGQPQLIDGKTCHPATPEQMAAEVLNWVDAGARVVGGCCGTTIEHYRQISAVLNNRKRRPNRTI
jgi:5-methyltetrahydrofolate--homocysteine methyltransferase